MRRILESEGTGGTPRGNGAAPGVLRCRPWDVILPLVIGKEGGPPMVEGREGRLREAGGVEGCWIRK